MRELTPAEAAILNQGVPEKGTGPAIINLVLDDIKDYPDTLKTAFIRRAAKGEHTYGYPLQANNGRDALIDLFQEVLDAALYAKQVLEEGSDDPFIGEIYQQMIYDCEYIHDMIQER